MGLGGAVRAASLSLFVLACVLGTAEGSYRFGTLSWRAVKDAPTPNTVEFELVTGWRRDFSWVYVRQAPHPLGMARALTDKPIVGDVLRVTGLYDQTGFADLDGSRALSGGTSQIMFHTGDGTRYFVDMTVTSFSESENWIIATSLIRHSYKTPYAGKKENIYPAGFTYDAGSQDESQSKQPFSHQPWAAAFEGCCRADLPTLPAVGGNANKPYRLETFVDLTDRDNAPGSRTLPIVTVRRWASNDPGVAPTFFVVAKDQFMTSADPPPRVSGGVSNFPTRTFANLTYKVATASDLGLTAAQYTPYADFSINRHTGEATFIASVEGFYQVAVLVDSPSSKTVIDFMVRVVPGANMPVPVGSLKQRVDAWVGYKVGGNTPISLAVTDPQNQTLVMNYVFAGLQFTATNVLTDSTGANLGLTYNPIDLNNQGLPPGAALVSSAHNAIVDIRISFDNPFSAHRPQHDAAVGKMQRDYASAPMARELWAAGYRPVYRTGGSGLNENALEDTIAHQAFDFNSGTGGAAVYMWVRRSDVEAAVTDINISTTKDQESALLAAGFTKLGQNLNEQSSSMSEVYMWFRRGSGPAIIDVLPVDVAVQGQCCSAGADQKDFGPINEVGTACARCPGEYDLVPANLNFGASLNKIFLYAKRAPPGALNKMLSWTPQVPGHYILCYSGMQVFTPLRLASTPRCIDINVRHDPAPAFVPVPAQKTFMGKTLTFKVAFIDIPHPEELVEIGMSSAGNTLAGAKFVSGVTLSPTASGWESSRMVEWFPDAGYGGFAGDVCFTAKDTANGVRAQHMSTGCLTIHVERCKWWVQSEDTLVQVAARFQTNWLQVWHFNPDILHPDNALPPGKIINTGHMYEVEPSDILSALAQRFGTTMAHIRMNNWDMGATPDTALQVGQHICVIPNSCVTAVNVQRTA